MVVNCCCFFCLCLWWHNLVTLHDFLFCKSLCLFDKRCSVICDGFCLFVFFSRFISLLFSFDLLASLLRRSVLACLWFLLLFNTYIKLYINIYIYFCLNLAITKNQCFANMLALPKPESFVITNIKYHMYVFCFVFCFVVFEIEMAMTWLIETSAVHKSKCQRLVLNKLDQGI